eukprot:4368491-Alexandrium_andersonii.AAC.1
MAVSSALVLRPDRKGPIDLKPAGGSSEGGNGPSSTSSRSNALCSLATLPGGLPSPCCRIG